MVGEDALEIYNTFSWREEGDDRRVSQIMEKLEAYCNPRQNVMWERHVFNTRNQQAGEMVDQYITDLKTKAKSCEFGSLTDSLIEDCIVCGIIDDRTRSRLLREPDLSLQKALDICRANEATATQMKLLTASGGASIEAEKADINAVEKSKPKIQSDKRKQQCGKCGTWHSRQQLCPANGVECHKCGKRNHFARVCRSMSRKPKVHSIEQESTDEDDDMFIAVVHDNRPGTKDWQASFKINGRQVSFKIDTGAQCNVISRKIYNQVGTEPLQRSQTRLVTFGGHKMKASGKAVIAC